MRGVLLLLAVCSLAPLRVAAQPQVSGVAAAARPHLQRGLQHFEAREYARALEAFRAAYQIDPQPALLYAIAQAERLSGDCRAAVRFYEAFLRTGPNARQAASARQNIERCAAEAERPPVVTPPASAPAAPAGGVAPGPAAPTGPPVVDHPPRPSWRGDRVGHGLVLSGLGLAVAGVAVWGVERAAVRDANAAPDYGTFAARARDAASAETWQKVGVATAAVGGALVVAGVLHYVLRGRGRAERPAVAAAFGRGTALLVLAAPW